MDVRIKADEMEEYLKHQTESKDLNSFICIVK